MHKIIYDSYVLKLVSTLVKNIELENASNYNLSKDIDFDFENDFDKQQLYEQFATYNCKGFSSALLRKKQRLQYNLQLTDTLKGGQL